MPHVSYMCQSLHDKCSKCYVFKAVLYHNWYIYIIMHVLHVPSLIDVVDDEVPLSPQHSKDLSEGGCIVLLGHRPPLREARSEAGIDFRVKVLPGGVARLGHWVT